MRFYLSFIIVGTILFAQPFYIKGGQKVDLQKIQKASKTTGVRANTVDKAYDVYETQENDIVRIDNKLFIQLVASDIEYTALLSSYNLTLIKAYSSKLLLVSSKSSDLALEALGKLINEPSVKQVFPNQYKDVQTR